MTEIEQIEKQIALIKQDTQDKERQLEVLKDALSHNVKRLRLEENYLAKLKGKGEKALD